MPEYPGFVQTSPAGGYKQDSNNIRIHDFLAFDPHWASSGQSSSWNTWHESEVALCGDIHGLVALLLVSGLERERLEDQGQWGLDGSRARGMNFVLYTWSQESIYQKRDMKQQSSRMTQAVTSIHLCHGLSRCWRDRWDKNSCGVRIRVMQPNSMGSHSPMLI